MSQVKFSVLRTDLSGCGQPEDQWKQTSRIPSRSIKPTAVPMRVGRAYLRTAIGDTVPFAIFYPRKAGNIRERAYKHWVEDWQGSATLTSTV